MNVLHDVLTVSVEQRTGPMENSSMSKYGLSTQLTWKALTILYGDY